MNVTCDCPANPTMDGKGSLAIKSSNLVLQGWRDGEEEEMRPFNRRNEELSVQDGCVVGELLDH